MPILKKQHKRYLIFIAVISFIFFSSCTKSTPKQIGSWVEIAQDVYFYESGCKAYAVKTGKQGVLIDSCLDLTHEKLKEIGIHQLDAILHTHYHRDNSASDIAVMTPEMEIYGPARSKRVMEDGEVFWNQWKIAHNYSFLWFYAPLERIPVTKLMENGHTAEINGHRFVFLHTPGHTPGSTSILAEIHGKRIAFVGDLLYDTGKLATYHDLQWLYCDNAGVPYLEKSLESVLAWNPDLLCPSHGNVMDRPEKAIVKTIKKLAALPALRAPMFSPNVSGEKRWEKYSDTIYHQTWLWGTSIALIKDGHALIIDAPNELLFEELQAKSGLDTIDIVMPTHYHDDHSEHCTEIRNKYNAKIWVPENIADILEHPDHYNIPCLPHTPMKADRILYDGEKITWRGIEIQCLRFPGQTLYHSAYLATIDNEKILFVGDSVWEINFRNRVSLNENEGNRYIAKKLLEIKPDILFFAHQGPVKVSRKQLQEYQNWAKDVSEYFTKLLPEPNPNFYTDPHWVMLYPYRQDTHPGDTIELTAIIRNYHDKPIEVISDLVVPSNWKSDKSLGKALTIPALQTAKLPLTLTVPADEKAGRRTIGLRIKTSFGLEGILTEALLDIKSN